MPRLQDLTGQTFGRLTVIVRGETRLIGRTHWRCSCDCGNVVSVDMARLKNGSTKSCGCLRKEITGKLSASHGLSKGKLYKVHQSMIRRCHNPKDAGFYKYGARGISVCDRWRKSVENFVEDMGYPQTGQSIDRIDNNGDYCFENCRWADSKMQSRNRRNNHFVTLNCSTRTIAEWSEVTGIKQSLISFRLKKGWSPERALSVVIPS